MVETKAVLLTAEPYKVAIAAALKSRGALKDDFIRHPVHPESNYVIRMCEKVLELIQNRGGCATLETVMRLERYACGHVDYHSKFALYCAEIEVGTRAMADEH